MKNNNLSITIGIPTCYSGKSIVRTVESIRNAELGKSVKIVITADRTPITEDVKNSLKKLKVILNWNNKEGSQFKKIKQMVDKCTSDIYISTQDDVTFDKNTIKSILIAFEKDEKLTMSGIRILPHKPVNLFESAMTSMLRIVDFTAQKWNKSDNHLASSGRCIAFRVGHLKKFRIPETIVNGDMFFYLENKNLKGKFRQLKDAIVYIRCPQSLKEQIAPSSRYLYSKEEMKKYFKFNLDKEYDLPKDILFLAFIFEFIKNPFLTFYYLIIRIFTIVKRQPKNVVSNPVWNIEASTKSI